MIIRLKPIFLISLTLLLGGCSYIQHSDALRNRTYDYSGQDEVNLPSPPKVPANLSTPQYAPALTIPPGPNNYPPSGRPEITPPGFDVQVPIPTLPPKAAASNS